MRLGALTVGESKFRCGKSNSRICTKPIESWLDRLRTMSGVSALSNETICESEMSRPRRHRVRASITSSVARSDIEMARLCSTSLEIKRWWEEKTNKRPKLMSIQLVQIEARKWANKYNTDHLRRCTNGTREIYTSHTCAWSYPWVLSYTFNSHKIKLNEMK